MTLYLLYKYIYNWQLLKYQISINFILKNIGKLETYFRKGGKSETKLFNDGGQPITQFYKSSKLVT